jgi:hypothetical protein
LQARMHANNLAVTIVCLPIPAAKL